MKNLKKLKRNSKIICISIILLMAGMLFLPIKTTTAQGDNTVNRTTEMNVIASDDNTIAITKIWDDEGHTNQRPSSVKYKLYKANDRNNVIATLQLTSNNSTGDYTWSGKFENIPAKDNNNQNISYVVVEEIIEKYISIADKTATTGTAADQSSGIKFKFNQETKLAEGQNYENMADGNAALKLYAHDLNTNTWYTLKPENYPGNGGTYIFRQDVINNTEYDISLENDMIQTNQPTLHNYNLGNGINYGTDIKTLGYIYPETKHPLAVGDSRSITYKASPKSSIEWIFDLDFISWGNGWGIKVDSLETTGVNNYFVSTYNQQDITFTKVFEDEGYEDLREDTEVYLYGDEVKKDTIILNTSTNKNKNEWQGVFKNVPIYDSNWKKIEYRIEEKKSNNYTAYYDTQEYNGLVVKFSADTQTEDVSGQDEINIYYVNGENKLVRIPHYSLSDWLAGNGSSADPITDSTIYIPSKEFYMSIKLVKNQNAKIKIEDIKPVANVPNFGGSVYTYPYLDKAHTGKDYLDFDSSRDIIDGTLTMNDSEYEFRWHYKYTDTNSFGTTKIINKINKQEIKKVWDDLGNRRARPDSVKIDIYSEKDPNTIINTVELTAENEDSSDKNVWIKYITGLPEYDESGNKINYIFKEKSTDKYETSYSNSKKIIGYEVTMNDDIDWYGFQNDVTVLTQYQENPENEEMRFYSLKGLYYYYLNYSSNKFVIPALDDSQELNNKQKIAFLAYPSSENKNYEIKSIRPIYEGECTLNVDSNTNGNITSYGSINKDTYNIQYISDDNVFIRHNAELYAENQRYTLFMYEVDRNEGYAGGNVIENKNRSAIPVIKNWDDDGNKIGRPDSIKIDVCSEKSPDDVITTLELTQEDEDEDDENTWKAFANGLPEHDDNGNKINYIFKEQPTDNYKPTYSTTKNIIGYEITMSDDIDWNKFRSEVIVLTQWVEKPNGEMTFIACSINFDANSNKFKIQVFDNPSLDNKKKIGFLVHPSGSNYDVRYEIKSIRALYEGEDTVDGWGYRTSSEEVNENRYNIHYIANNDSIYYSTESYAETRKLSAFIYEIDKNEPFPGATIITNKEVCTSVPVTKIWNDADNQDGKRPSEVTVNLFADGEKIKSEKVKASDGWKYTFKQLDIYNDQNERIVYTITEDEVEGYATVVNGYTITNSYTPEKISISGKKTWDDSDNQDGKRPQKVKINLLANGTKVAETEATAQTEWKYTFTNVDKYKNGEEIKYTISEDEIPEYQISYDNFDVTNIYTPKTINISGAKIWDDNGNQDGIRPAKVKIMLYADGVEIDSKEVTEESNWLYEFSNLPQYKDGGKEIVYTVDEEAVEGYTNKQINGFNITNSHAPETINISGEKTWKDSNNKREKRPEKITINVYDGVVEVASKDVTEKDNWKYQFTNLPKYKNGNEIKYTIIEDEVENYITTVKGFDVTNTYKTEEQETPENPDTPKADEEKKDDEQKTPETPQEDKAEETEKVEKEDVEKSPKTSDNIFIVIGILIIAVGGTILIKCKSKSTN